MTDSTESGLHTNRPREYFFAPYHGTQFDLPKTSPSPQSPVKKLSPCFEKYTRSKYHTIYDVRNTYSADHILRLSDAEQELQRRQLAVLVSLKRETEAEARARERRELKECLREEIQAELDKPRPKKIYSRWGAAVAYVVFLLFRYFWSQGSSLAVLFGMLLVIWYPRVMKCLEIDAVVDPRGKKEEESEELWK